MERLPSVYYIYDPVLTLHAKAISDQGFQDWSIAHFLMRRHPERVELARTFANPAPNNQVDTLIGFLSSEQYSERLSSYAQVIQAVWKDSFCFTRTPPEDISAHTSNRDEFSMKQKQLKSLVNLCRVALGYIPILYRNNVISLGINDFLLSPLETAMLHRLYQMRDKQAVDPVELMSYLYGKAYAEDSKLGTSGRVNIRRLREKLRKCGSDVEIQEYRLWGYRLMPDV